MAQAQAEAAMAPATPAQTLLPPLREELALHPGPSAPDGSPTWTLYDPASHRFFRIGWLEARMLEFWPCGNAGQVAAAVSATVPFVVDSAAVVTFLHFLHRASLLRLHGNAALERLGRLQEAGQLSWAAWLLKNYLFFRIPLVRPDGFLRRTLPWVRGLASPLFAGLLLLAGLVGGWLVARQWQTFLHTFLHFFSLEGAVLFAVALTGAKVLHEFGHAYTACHYGCRVPTMGVAFMVLWPVLYTDTTEAWKLPSRRQRLILAGAGIAAEMGLAALALLAWSFLPEGPGRSVAFVLASSTWIMTLAINLNPFMRFDGYYLLADGLDIPNLQDRAFALARWWLREALFGLGRPRPEVFPPRVERILVVYAFGTWIYRFFLFLGIAFLVYGLAFKLLGLLLMAVEIGWFIVRPVVMELNAWHQERQRFRLNRRMVATLCAAGLGLAALLAPWRGTVEAPALLKAGQESTLYTEVPGQLLTPPPHAGQQVAAGDVLFRFDSPEIRHALTQTAHQSEVLRGQAAFQSGDREHLERRRIAWQELATVQAEHQAHRREEERLTLRAPFAGQVVDVMTPLAVGEWLKPGEALAVVLDPQHPPRLEAFVSEADLGRLQVGGGGRFLPEVLEQPPVPVRIVAIDGAAIHALPDPALASEYKGGIAARPKPDGSGLVAEAPVYRVLLEPETPHPSPTLLLRGVAHLDAERISIAGRVARLVLGVLIRESGF